MDLRFTMAHWLSLKPYTQRKVAEIFSIKPSGPVHVSDNRVVDSGHKDSDFAGINVKNMQAYLKSEETDYFILLNELIKSIGDEPVAVSQNASPLKEKIRVEIHLNDEKIDVTPQIVEPQEEVKEPEEIAPTPKKKGRPAKKK